MTDSSSVHPSFITALFPHQHPHPTNARLCTHHRLPTFPRLPSSSPSFPTLRPSPISATASNTPPNPISPADTFLSSTDSLTTLLLDLPTTSLKSLSLFLPTWLDTLLFSSRPFSTPLSIHITPTSSSYHLLFYANDASIRGTLTFTPLPTTSTTLLRVSSASRFVGPSGFYTATLPGERRILRHLCAQLQRRFPRMAVLYKPPYIRLRKQAFHRPHPPARGRPDPHTHLHVVAFVAELRAVAKQSVLRFLANWAADAQFGAATAGVSAALVHPFSVVPDVNAVRLLTSAAGLRGERLLLTAEVKVRPLVKVRPEYKLIVVVSVPDFTDAAIVALVNSLSKQLLLTFPNTRIHTQTT